MKIVINLTPQGQVALEYPENVPPMFVVGLMEMAKAVFIANMSKPANSIIPASATDLPR